MRNDGPEEWIVVTESAKTLPIQEILTGRGFVSGKSGSGKSNTVSVICEELLEANFTLLIVDTEGEYFGLKEEYQLLHVGGDDFAEVQVGPEHADRIAEISLEKNVPVILDVSGYDDTDVSEELITRVIDELYSREKHVRKPFLLVVEEMQEYLPQQGGSGELAELLERVAKRGRKRGLGMCGVSQRPSSVDKDYITQCDWMAWHKFTWESDLRIVENVIGKERAARCENFDPGEAYLMLDWDDSTELVQFRRKRTFDAGATPGLEAYERPDLKRIGDQFIAEIEGSGGFDGIGTIEAPDGADVANADVANADVANADVANAGAAESQAGPVADDLGAELSTPNEHPSEAASTAESELPNESDSSAAAAVAAASPAELEALFETDLEPEALAELDEAEIIDRVKQMHTENRILKDEVEELREIRETDPNATDTPFASQTGSASSQSTSPAFQYGPNSSRQRSRKRPIDPPTRPTAPARQDVDDTAASVLFEFGELMIYLFKLCIYYLLYAIYRTRVWVRSRRS